MLTNRVVIRTQVFLRCVFGSDMISECCSDDKCSADNTEDDNDNMTWFLLKCTVVFFDMISEWASTLLVSICYILWDIGAYRCLRILNAYEMGL